MTIGNLNLGTRLIQAPMAEVTDSSFRSIARSFGVGLTFTQMVSAKGILNNDFTSLRYLSFSRDEKPIGVQILGNDPHIIGEAVKEIAKFKPDVIDLNCGCPVDKVTSKKMGSALLEYPDLIGEITRKMVDNSGGIPISVKVRLGVDKKNINVLNNAKVIEDNGASIIVVHARTMTDRYDIDADWSWIGEVKKNVSMKVIGNGSIFTPQDGIEMLKQTNCDGVMVARASIGNPFIFSRFNSLLATGEDPGMPSIEIVKSALMTHLKMLWREYDEIKALDRSKKYVIWYYQFYNGINELIKRIFSAKNYERLIEIVEKHHEDLINHRYLEDTTNYNDLFKKRVVFWQDNINSDVA